MPISRRRILSSAAAPLRALSPPPRGSNRPVQAYPIRVAGMAGGAVPKFTSDFDPARSDWIGPFAQLWRRHHGRDQDRAGADGLRHGAAAARAPTSSSIIWARSSPAQMP
jgi:hypothetical protein